MDTHINGHLGYKSHTGEQYSKTVFSINSTDSIAYTYGKIKTWSLLHVIHRKQFHMNCRIKKKKESIWNIIY